MKRLKLTETVCLLLVCGTTYGKERLVNGAAARAAGRAGIVMKVAATQPQPDWQRYNTRDIFNALSQGEIGKRAFTAALAKRLVSKAIGMQRDYELQSEVVSEAASSSAVIVDEGEARFVEAWRFLRVSTLVATSFVREILCLRNRLGISVKIHVEYFCTHEGMDGSVDVRSRACTKRHHRFD